MPDSPPWPDPARTIEMMGARLGLWWWNLSNDEIFWSDGCYDALGLSREDYTPGPEMKRMHPDDVDRVRRALPTHRDGRLREITYRAIDGAGGVRHISAQAVFHQPEDGAGPFMLGTMSNVTDLVETREELRRSAEVARHMQRTEIIGRIAGGVAHDFNNLLSVVVANAELIEIDPADADNVESRDEILEACDRGKDLTMRLLGFARPSEHDPRPHQIGAIIEGALKLMRRAATESVEFRFQVAGDLWPAMLDRALLESSLINIVINAREAMPDGGAITFEAENVRVGEADMVEGERVAPGRYVRLTVTDTGAGIPAELVDRVHEPFFSTKGPHFGAGLGLAMVHAFVRRSGGALKVRSEVGVGTSIVMHLPAAPAEDRRPSPRRAAAPDLDRLAGARVLLVEDEAAIRTITTRMLTDAGMSVVAAANGDRARAIFETDATGFDLLLSDVVMPGALQGHHLAAALLERRPSLRVILMSGYPNDAIRGMRSLPPGCRMMRKPIRKADLLQAIANALSDR